MNFSKPLFASNKIIHNLHVPVCVNCVHYIPCKSSSKFAIDSSKCGKFGEKDIITNEINYAYAKLCRKDIDRCSLEGRYWEQEPNLQLKKWKHFITENNGLWIVIYMGMALSIPIGVNVLFPVTNIVIN